MDYHGTSGNDVIDQAELKLPENVNVYGEGGDDTITLSNGNMIGGAGNNTLIATGKYVAAVYWSSPNGVNVNLQTGIAQNGFGGIDKLVNVNNLFGSNGNDIIIGNSQDNNFTGMGGSDVFTGGGGYDVVTYFTGKSTDVSVTYDAATDTMTVVKNFPNGDHGTDILHGIDRIDFNDDAGGKKSIYAIDFKPHPKFTFAGIWSAMIDPPANAGIVWPYATQVPLGSEHKNGVVLDSWVYQGGFGGAASVVKVNVGILEQQADGMLKLATSKYVSDSVTNGAGSINIADFNGDGQADIFLAAHNESPFTATPSTVYMSNKSGTFDKLVLSDAVMAHDAELSYINGKPTIFTRTYSPGDSHPTYQFVDGKFVERKESVGQNQLTGGMSVAVADFNSDGKYEMVIGDLNFGPGYEYDPKRKFVIGVYELEDIQNSKGKPQSIITPYFTTNAQYKDTASAWGVGWTHTYRLWTDDFNHDGMLDIVAGQSMWSPDNPQGPAALQMLQNKGNLQFVDMTDQLNQAIPLNIEEFDYNMQRIDLDHSGIQSYLSAHNGATLSDTETRASNFLLLNDGTGKLYVALHNEFFELSQQVHRFLQQSKEVIDAGLASSIDVSSPQTDGFVAYQLPDGALNFLAVTNGGLLTSVGMHYDITTDYKVDVQVDDRNQSKLMRTWAGNDTFSDKNANSSAHLDGGLGQDTAIYSYPQSSYSVGLNADGAYTVSGHGLSDVLVNIERLRFSDSSLYLVTSPEVVHGSAGSDQFLGSAHDDQMSGDGGDDVIDGGDGIDTAMYLGKLANYKISKNSGSYALTDKTGLDGSDVLKNVERLHFSDVTVNLGVQAKAASLPAANVQSIIELYIAFFNRVPDADGVSYWIDQFKAGQSISQISESFYHIGASSLFSSLTGFSTNMTNDDFINTFYKNVLGRSEGADAGGLDYWRAKLLTGASTRGSLAQDILTAAHTFKGDATYGYVADLLDNKFMLGKQISVDWGITFNSDIYTRSVEISKAITATSTDAALKLIGVNVADLHL